MVIPEYPLQWPDSMPRTRAPAASAFKTGLSAALANVSKSLVAFGRDSGKPVADIVLSSNVSLTNPRPPDPGVAAWFSWDGDMRCIAVDRYAKVEDNLQAIHHVLEARRTELRHGTLALVRATFQGFKALPPPSGHRDWPAILGLPRNATKAEIEAAYRAKAPAAHPDKVGGREAWDELNRAKTLALRDLSG